MMQKTEHKNNRTECRFLKNSVKKTLLMKNKIFNQHIDLPHERSAVFPTDRIISIHTAKQ